MARKSPATSKRPSPSRRGRPRPQADAKTVKTGEVLDAGDTKPLPFHPTPAMQTFAAKYVEAITEGALPVRLQDVAAAAQVSPQTVSEWRNDVPGFRDWLNGFLERYVATTWPAVQAVCVRFALRGSIEHMKFLRELMHPKLGPGPALPVGNGAPVIGAVILNVPQPPDELNGHPLYVGLLGAAVSRES